MAVTKGHGNPNWTRDEVILALDLYFDCQGRVPRSTDSKVQALSRLLRSAPSNSNRKPSFRNPDGVSFKLQNLNQIATGVGLANTSETDRKVWETFGSDPTYAKAIANRIREFFLTVGSEEFGDVDLEFSEGRIATWLHLRRERSHGLMNNFIKMRKGRGALSCDICTRYASDFSCTFGDSVFECHHLLPLAVGGERLTQLKDLALLCANCHRLIHRAIAKAGRWLAVSEARTLILG